MASPDPTGYHAHPHHHHHQQPSPPYGHAMEEEEGGHRMVERYGDRDIMAYAEQSQQALPSEEQPLDLTVTSRPRSAGAHHHSFPASSTIGGHSALRPPSPSSSMIAVSSHPGVCLLKGCSCSQCSALQPTHHTPHYSGHRHSPYPPSQYSPPRSGHRSPGVSGPDSAPHCYTPPTAAPPPGSVLPPEQRGRGSPYFMDRPCRSPHGAGSYMMSSLSPYASDTMMRPGTSPGSALLYPPPPHATASPHSLSPRPRGVDWERDNSPRPSSNHASPARARDVSPRPLYRPFEASLSAKATAVSNVESTSFSSLATTISSSMTVLGDRYRHTSEDDLTASSSLLLLARPPPPHHASEKRRDYREEEGEDRRRREAMIEAEDHHDRPSQSDCSSAQYHQLVPMNPASQSLLAPPSCYFSSQPVSSECCQMDSPQPRAGVVDTGRSQRSSSGPAQDHTVASTSPSPFSDSDLSHSSSPAPAHAPAPRPCASHASSAPSSPSIINSSSSNVPEFAGSETTCFKVVGTTPLAIIREKRARLEMKQYKENMKSLIAAGGSGRLLNLHVAAQESEGGAADNENDGSGAAVELNSTGQVSPGASSSSTMSNEDDLANDFPLPPDPNLKMSALDYLISKVLVERIDVPFKPFNKEVNDIYTGTKKGRLSLVDLIELRVEASLKAS